MSFNFSRKLDFLPKIFFGDDELEVVHSIKLLGVIISDVLKWNEHTLYIVKKAKQRLWTLRRLSRLGASRDTLLNQYHLMIRSIEEMGAPVFTGGLSKTNIDDIEQVQKGAFKIILKGDYINYESALTTLGEKTLEQRRADIALKFAKTCVSHPKMSHLFQKSKNERTRSGETCFFETQFNSARGFNGPISYLIRLLNDTMGKIRYTDQL